MTDLESYLEKKRKLKEKPQIQRVLLMGDEDYELGDYLFDGEFDFFDNLHLGTSDRSTLFDHPDEDDDPIDDDLLDDF